VGRVVGWAVPPLRPQGFLQLRRPLALREQRRLCGFEGFLQLRRPLALREQRRLCGFEGKSIALARPALPNV
jgi:hypothetical protein